VLHRLTCALRLASGIHRLGSTVSVNKVHLTSISCRYEPGPRSLIDSSYHQLFQPDPALDSYGLPPPNPNYDNSRLGPLASQVHVLLGNWITDLLALNAAQHAILTDLIQNAHHDYRLVHIIPTSLPPVNTEKKKHRVSLPTVPLPDNA